jgi:hypothetical protein
MISRIEKFKNLNNPIFIRLETQNLSDEKMKIYTNLEILLIYNFKIILISKKKYESNNVKWVKLHNFSNDWRFPEII